MPLQGQLREWARKTPLISSDDIIKAGLRWCSVDTLPQYIEDRNPVIMNTDISSGKGIHWITIVGIDKVAFIIDPLGKDNYRAYDKLMFDTFKSLKMKPVFYPGKFQYADTQVCGLFAMQCALALNNLKEHAPNYELSDATQVIYDLFGKTADANDLKIARGLEKGLRSAQSVRFAHLPAPLAPSTPPY